MLALKFIDSELPVMVMDLSLLNDLLSLNKVGPNIQKMIIFLVYTCVSFRHALNLFLLILNYCFRCWCKSYGVVMLWSALDPHHHNQGPPEGPHHQNQGPPEESQGPPNLKRHHEGGTKGTTSAPFGNVSQYDESAGHIFRKQWFRWSLFNNKIWRNCKIWLSEKGSLIYFEETCT